MNGRRKRILTSLGSLSFATLLAEIAFKRQLDKDLQKEMQGAGEKRNSPSEKWNSPSPPCFARSLPPRGSREAADNFCLIVRKHDEARGSLGKMKKFESTSIVCLRRHFPRYRRFFRAFLSQEKKRKRGKQG